MRPTSRLAPAAVIALGCALAPGCARGVAGEPSAPMYRQDFSGAKELPQDLMPLSGEFSVAQGDDPCLEVAPTPLETFTFLFATEGTEGRAVRLRAFGEAQGRRAPTLGVGLGGVAGLVLRLAAAKRQLELVADDQVLTTVPYEAWQSGAWTWLHLQVRRDGGGFTAEAKAWQAGAAEPAAFAISHRLPALPGGGRASAWAIPYAGKPLRFDDLQVSNVAGGQ